MLNDEVRAIWDANAEFWDGGMGEGNFFHKILIEPTQLKLLNIKPGQKILDIACGNGQFARKMAESGADVTATDFSEKMIEIAKSKPGQHVEYQVIDATRKDDLEKLPGDFDSMVCTMAMMDMENIVTLIQHAPRLIKKEGTFVFSILHPCFNSGSNTLLHERDDLSGRVEDRYYVKIRDYLIDRSEIGVAMAGQPKSQYYFHRPVSTILRHFFEAGFVLDAFEEPSFRDRESTGIFDNVFKNIPAAMVCRLRLMHKGQGA